MGKHRAPSTHAILFGSQAGKALRRRLLARAEGEEQTDVDMRPS